MIENNEEKETIQFQEENNASFDTNNERGQMNKPNKTSWIKQITKQTIISSVIFFVLGGAISATVVSKILPSGAGTDIADNRGFPDGEQGQPGKGGPNGGNFDEDQTQNSDGTSQTDGSNTTTSSATSNNNA